MATLAGPALPLAVRPDVGVFGVIGVPLRAMSLERMSTAPHVLCMGNRLQVGWVDAITNPAQVVELESVRYRPNEHFVSEPVGIDSATVRPKLAITVGANVWLPDPAPIRIRHDLGQKSI